MSQRVSQLDSCRYCGVPLGVGARVKWNSNGTITQKHNPDQRMIFFESDSFDALFTNLEQLIGISIEKLVIESKARATLRFMQKQMPGRKGRLAVALAPRLVAGKIVEQCKVQGMGAIKKAVFRRRGGYASCKMENPYSLSMFCGDFKGAIEAALRVSCHITHKEIGKDTFLIEGRKAPTPQEMGSRFVPRPAALKPGNIEYDLCPECGVPHEMSHFTWNLGRGSIRHAKTGTRMVLTGPDGLQVLFDELEKELGEPIPSSIIEAHRLQFKAILPLPRGWEMPRMETVRKWLAIRGLGNLVMFEQSEKEIKARIENPAVPLMTVGRAAILHEFVTGQKLPRQWGLEEDGDLVLTYTMSP